MLEDMARGFVGSGVAAAVVLVRGAGVKAGRRWCVSLAPFPHGVGVRRTRCGGGGPVGHSLVPAF